MEKQQRRLCAEHGAAFDPPPPGSRLGIALQTLGAVPLHGMRIPPHDGVCGWYVWAGEGELPEEPHFFKPLCVEHLPRRCPLAVRFLALPPGWRFLTDGGYTDVWFDECLRHYL